MDKGIRPERFSSEAFEVVAKMQLAPQMKPERTKCRKLRENRIPLKEI
jgi:hypothetical protein